MIVRNPMHALIVEPQAFTACAIEFALRDIGYTSFDFAMSAEEAIACADQRRPDLITSAVHLEPGCGIATAERICSRAPVPVVFITHEVSAVKRVDRDVAVVPKHPFLESELSAAVASAVPLCRRAAA